MFQKVNTHEYQFNAFNEIGDNWTLISAPKGDRVNTMTASWGGLGVLWGRDVATVYIRQTRYTKEFVDGQDHFTLSLFDGYRKELALLGTKSGRDGDKIAEVGFHVEEVEGQPAFAESKAVMICKKLYQDDIPLDKIPADIVEKFYDDGDYHTMYIGEITALYVNEG